MPRTSLKRAVEPLAHLSLNTKGILVVAIPVCALLVAVGLFSQLERRTNAADAAVVHTYEVGSELRQVVTLLVNAETGIRGYLLTQDERFLQPYTAAREETEGHFNSLQKLLSDRPAEPARLASVRLLTNDVLGSLEHLRQSAGRIPQAEKMAALELGKASMDELRSQLAAMLAAEHRLRESKAQEAQDARRKTEVAIFAGGVLGLAGGFFAILLFTSRITKRVQRVEEDARRVARGIPLQEYASGTDEIGRLEGTLRETSRLLTRQAEELQAAHADLESRVAQRTAALLEMNEELRKATEVRQAIVRSTPLAIWATDNEGKVTFWNPAAERIFGWTENEAVGRPLRVIPPELQDEYREWRGRFLKGESLAAVERSRVRKDGSRLAASIWTAPLRDAAGDVSGTITIDDDITQRKLLEEQFRQSQKLEAVGQLAGGVAHDFNNLLTVIMGYVEMLIMETREMPALAEYLLEVQYAADRAASLTSQLLAFSRRQIIQPRVLNLNEVVVHSMKLLRRVIGEDIEISTHLDPNLGRVRADPSHIDQVIMNLVVNARDAMTGGGKLTIDTANVRLDEQYTGRHIGVKPGPYCLLAISDTGAGMSAETRERLFEPFFTTKESGKGTGLGLSIVYGIVKQSGGEIMAYSEPGKGTTLKIYLPMTEAGADAAGVESSGLDIHGTETVLVCEDESGIRKLVANMLGRLGYRVLEAATPAEAMRVAQDGDRVDLLLTDVVMPETNGFELAAELRRMRPQLRVVYMSGYTDNRVSGSWELDRQMPFLQKPFTAANLGQKLREALGKAMAG